MSRFLIGNVFLGLSVTCAALSQLMTKALINEVSAETWGESTWRMLLTPGRLSRGAAAAVILVAGFGFWLLSLTRLDLSYAYPLACTSVVLVALCSGMFLGEVVTLRMWLGTLLILLGVALLAPQ